MIKYLKIKFDESNNTQECFWYLEIDTNKEQVLREIQTDIENKIIRKAPTHEDNYGVFTDNLNVIISPQKPRYKETIIFDLNNEKTQLITKEEFEKYWIKEYVYIKKNKIPLSIIFILIILLIIVFSLLRVGMF